MPGSKENRLCITLTENSFFQSLYIHCPKRFLGQNGAAKRDFRAGREAIKRPEVKLLNENKTERFV